MDLKFIWEPARFGWAFSLGRAYHLTRREKYAEAFWKYFERFDSGNPPYLGPHWMNGQEVAIRLMALVWSAAGAGCRRGFDARGARPAWRRRSPSMRGEFPRPLSTRVLRTTTI